MTMRMPDFLCGSAVVEALRKSEPGDVIQVNTHAQSELAKAVMKRSGVLGVSITWVQPVYRVGVRAMAGQDFKTIFESSSKDSATLIQDVVQLALEHFNVTSEVALIHYAQS